MAEIEELCAPIHVVGLAPYTRSTVIPDQVISWRATLELHQTRHYSPPIRVKGAQEDITPIVVLRRLFALLDAGEEWPEVDESDWDPHEAYLEAEPENPSWHVLNHDTTMFLGVLVYTGLRRAFAEERRGQSIQQLKEAKRAAEAAAARGDFTELVEKGLRPVDGLVDDVLKLIKDSFDYAAELPFHAQAPLRELHDALAYCQELALLIGRVQRVLPALSAAIWAAGVDTTLQTSLQDLPADPGFRSLAGLCATLISTYPPSESDDPVPPALHAFLLAVEKLLPSFDKRATA